MYTYAVKFIEENEILGISSRSTSLTALDYLEYFFYAGLCFIGVKKYNVAVEYFLQAIVFPAQAVSTVVTACIKAARLASLVDSGNAFEVPKYASNIVSRFAKQDSPVYDALVKAFLANDSHALTNHISTGGPVLNADHSLGLAYQMVAALTNSNIKKLTSTYITLSLEDISTSTGLANIKVTENLLLKMVSQGKIKARINQQSGMVHFGDDGEVSSSSKVQNNEKVLSLLVTHIEEGTDIAERIRLMQQTVLSSEAYAGQSQRGHGVGKGGISQGDIGWSNEEDLMDFMG
eukprot:CAMPEP_0119035740 /NCGR_PEP_ID=MMETSP1177-20130426/2946_1 /TAXON_ID=2985 /ORGANISM="Ochromonas sp, Strain CCMP1899" /LENGTH=290 /DNA_ID=CAMNT_0006994443 /DNA_START=527 /DNA_END=1399 /DNA_ORIENTATION=-